MSRCRTLIPYSVLLLLLGLSPPAFSGMVCPSPRSATAAVHDLAGLPIDAQARISAVLGRDQRVYHVRPEGEAMHLVNPSHGLKAKLTAEGVEIASAGTRIQLRLRGVGRGAKLEALGPTKPAAKANRIEYRRMGLAEWYVNGPLGLEQGFTLENPPGRATGEALTLALDLGGEPGASPTADGMLFHRPDGAAALKYSGLAAWDASGRKLPAWWQQSGTGVRLRVDDTGAHYPVTIDPFVQQAKLTASDRAEADQFGLAVAVSGDTVVVGAPVPGSNDDPGSAYVFVAPPGGFAGTLTETARLRASDRVGGDGFGTSVAISGDTVVVGAPIAKVGRGSAYVFVAPPGGFAGALTESARLSASDGADNESFGFSVGVSGDTVVVGAPVATNSRGSAYVFVAPPGGFAGALTESARLNAADRAENDSFGISVGVSGDTVVVGAPFANSSRGSAYVFVAPPGGFAGALTETRKLTASDGSADDNLGISVAISEDTAVAGTIGTDAFQGSAYAFVAPPGGFGAQPPPEQSKLTASDGSESDFLGFAVAISGDTLVAGAPGDDIGGLTDAGSAYVFVQPSGPGGPPPPVDPPLPPGSVVCRGVVATIVGTELAETLLGTPGPDVIAGLGGDDTIRGLDGNDVLCGGPGNDRITGGSGRDRLSGEGGRDTLRGGRGRDILEGGPGNDTLSGDSSRDTCNGGPGRDRSRSCEAEARRSQSSSGID